MLNFGGGGGDDQLKLDVIIDDHGGVKRLADVDAGVAKVVNTAKGGTPSMEALNKQFADARLRLDALQAKLAPTQAGLLSLNVVLGVGAAAAAAYGMALRAAAADAAKFSQAADDLGEDASRIAQLTAAAADNRVGLDKMIGGLHNFQERIASGKIDADIQRLIGNLEDFKDAGITEQFVRASEAIAAIESPLERAAAKAQLFGGDAKEMGKLAKEGFREAVEGADAMSKETIKRLDEAELRFDNFVAAIIRKSKILAAESAMFVIDPLGRGDLAQLGQSDLPAITGPRRGELPAGPSMPDEAAMARAESQMRFLELQQEEEANWYRIDAVMRNIADAQDLIVRSGGDWSDVLNTRVATAVDKINVGLVNAVMLNSQLAGNAQSERDRLMAQLTSTTNPGESEFDKRFNEIDQAAKGKLAAVDQTDRVSAAAAENAILEEMNLKVMELQQHWEAVGAKTDDARNRSEMLKQSYESITRTPFVSQNSAGGGRLPNGLQAPTAEQVATGRYFGPVTPNGQPDLGRMGGAAPAMQITTHIDAKGSLIDSPGALDNLVARLEVALRERASLQGEKA